VCFGCPYEGPITSGQVVEVTERLIDAGAQEIAYADTIGVANPALVVRLVGDLHGGGRHSRSACTSTTPAGWVWRTS
jgi:isopropylmalate/homocitrate/citramalate synthase